MSRTSISANNGKVARGIGSAHSLSTFVRGVCEIKAVNPRARDERDTRTPSEILASIAMHGAQVELALKQLRKAMKATGVRR